MAQPGVTYQHSANGLQHLPLEELRVAVFIIDTTARVTLTQIFSNASDVATPRCKYVFPVPASAAVCAFEMETSDGRTVFGVVREKDRAREQYEQALRAGQFAGLVKYVTDDIFTMSIGTLDSHSTIQTRLTYVMNLANDDNLDDVRFQLFMGVGQRYGTTPSDLTDAVAPTSRTCIQIKADIQMSGIIQEIASPSHPREIIQRPYPTRQGRESRRRFRIKYRSPSFLDRDFVLIVRSLGLDAPRCFAELRQDEDGYCTVAMQLSLIPKNSLPPIVSQEYLFLIDRSGSMSGERIEQAKQTVNLLLRMLPANGTMFNVFAFNYSVNGLWPKSSAYCRESLNSATTYVNFLHARGGTEIVSALQVVLQSRNNGIPTAAFVLTDGEVFDVEAAISIVEASVKEAAPHAPLRVFTLGIGDGVSSATCEGIARAGHGTCFFAPGAEQILGKCARLFIAGRTPFVQNVTIDWGIQNEQLATPGVTPLTTVPTTVAIHSLPIIQQVPSQIHELHAGTRMNIFALFKLRRDDTPTEITLRGELKGSGTPFALAIPICGVQLAETREPDAPLPPPPIHTLAVWRLIQEHQEKRMALPAPLDPTSTEEEIRRAVIVHLGEKYQLVSQHTSFVAVDYGQNGERRTYRRSRRRTSGAQRYSQDVDTERREDAGLHGRLRRFILGFFGFGMLNEIVDRQTQTLPGAWGDGDSSRDESMERDNDNDDDDNGNNHYSGAESFSTMSSVESCDCSDWSDWSAPPSPRLPPVSGGDDESERSPKMESMDLAPDGVRQNVSLRSQAAPDLVPTQVVHLFSLQTFDGSFPLDESLTKIVGLNAVQAFDRSRFADSVWATAVSVAFIKKHMANRRELLHDLLAKAEEFLRGNGGLDFDDLMKAAENVIV